MTIHATIADLIEQEIIPSLGDYGNDYDIDGFVAELNDRGLIRWVETGNLARDGYELVADDDEFWATLSEFDTTAQ